MKKNIILLTGFMAAGKTTLGRKMAQEKHCAFIDLDEYIEEKEKISISKIFEMFGEGYFRKIETKCFKEILESEFKQKELIVAAGGGFPLRYENQQMMKSVTTIFVNTPFDVIERRLTSDEINKRPILKNNGALKELYDNRLAVYLATADSLFFA